MGAPSPDHLHGIVDMGSNGIRFSISDLSSPSARSLPTIFTSRSPISLYDAQYPSGSSTRQPIPSSVIDEVVAALLRFKTVCQDFNVPGANVNILATEATRTAVNAEQFLGRVKEEVGWEVEMLKKEEEGRVGAMGIASSFEEVKGLVMDLGGGSCQITWMVSRSGKVTTSPKGAFSFPYGAAALIRELNDRNSEDEKTQLAEEMQENFRRACEGLEIPPELLKSSSETAGGESGIILYLSGGGFRGWGYLLMSQSPKDQPYPIPIVNGFQAQPHEFQATETVQATAAATLEEGSKKDAFRISKRRASQVPAVAFLVRNLIQALPVKIKEAKFCQGGIREGYLFNLLSEEIRAQEPLVAASARYAPLGAEEIAALIYSALPEQIPARIRCCRRQVIQSLANTMYIHASYPKESAAAAALYVAIHGPLSAAHGVGHADRAALGLMLCERWGAEIPPTDGKFRERLEMVLSSAEEVWWCRFVGRVAGLVGDVYPAGFVGHGSVGKETRRIGFQAKIEEGGMGKRGNERGVRLDVRVKVGDRMTNGGSLAEGIEEISKLGKTKNWAEREETPKHGGAWGLRVEVELARESV